MEYVYAAMLLHKASQKITDDNVKKVLEAAHVVVDSAKVKALVAALEGVDIEEAIKKSAIVAAPVAAAAAPAHAGASEHKKEEKKDDKASEEQAAAGLSALFG